MWLPEICREREPEAPLCIYGPLWNSTNSGKKITPRRSIIQMRSLIVSTRKPGPVNSTGEGGSGTRKSTSARRLALEIEPYFRHRPRLGSARAFILLLGFTPRTKARPRGAPCLARSSLAPRGPERAVFARLGGTPPTPGVSTGPGKLIQVEKSVNT